MIKNWKTLLLTFVVGAIVYLFSAATTEYGEIRKDIVKEAVGYSTQDGNTLRFTALAASVTERQRGRIESLRALEHNAPAERNRIDATILALEQAEKDCASDTALLSGFLPANDSIAHARELLLAEFKAENDLSTAVIAALKRGKLNGSPDIAALDAQLVQKGRTLFSSIDEERGQLKDLEAAADNSIREYERRYNVLGIKVLSALLFVIAGSATLIVTFLRERNRKLSQERFNQRLSA
jgi:hypothetical protein